MFRPIVIPAMSLILLAACPAFPAGSADDLRQQVEPLIDRRYTDTNAVPASYAMLQNGVGEHPEDAALWTALARVCYIRGEAAKEKAARLLCYEEGLAAGRRAVSLNTNSTDALLWTMANLGRTAELKGVFKALPIVREVRRLNERMLAIDPNFVPGLQAKANLCWQLPAILGGDDDLAVECLDKALALKPGDTSLWLNLALVRWDRGEKAKAVECIDKVLAMNPDNPEHRFEVRPMAEALARKWKPRK